MASVSLLSVGFLVLAAEVMCLQKSSYNSDTMMEQEELLGLYEVLGSLLEDPTWSQMHPQPCSDTPWPGVQCEIGQDPSIFHVTQIHIGLDVVTPPCKTSAKLSESLQKLPYLKTLSLFNCFTSSPFSLPPTLFGTFSTLERLALESNPTLSGNIPQSLAKVSSLRVLSLSQNNLQGEIPKEISGLVNLEQLDLSYNHLSGSIPEEIGGLTSLAILDLSWNGLEGQVPSSLGQLRLLQKIDFGSNKLQGRLTPNLGQLKRLVLLDLSQNLISGPIPEPLSVLQQLEYFLIDDNPINTGIPLFLGALRKLTVLSLSGCGLTGPIPTSFSNLKNLTALSLDNNSINGTVPPNLGTLANLDLLNLSQNQLSGELLLPEEFITKLGKRFDARGNNGLFTRQQLYKNKNISTNLKTPSCLDTSTTVDSGNKTWAEEHHPEVCKKLKPSWYHGKISSNTHGLDQKLVIPIVVVWFMTSFF